MLEFSCYRITFGEADFSVSVLKIRGKEASLTTLSKSSENVVLCFYNSIFVNEDMTFLRYNRYNERSSLLFQMIPIYVIHIIIPGIVCIDGNFS